MSRFIYLASLAAVLLSACAAPAARPQTANPQTLPTVTVYRSPT